MNVLERILISGAAGTSAMTATSALMSLLPNEDFKEPKHLTTMVGRILPASSKPVQQGLGWAAHYAMGFAFTTVYTKMWQSGNVKKTIKNGVILGAISGIAGILIWKATFKFHPLPPRIKYLDFYVQRIPAHVIFAVAVTVADQLLEKQRVK